MRFKTQSFQQNYPFLIGIFTVMVAIATWYKYTAVSDAQVPVSKINPLAIDSCQLALADHKGKSRIDLDIARYQKLSQGTHSPNAYLEKLGWAYIRKARSSFDPGYFKLAQQTGLCLQRKNPNSLQAQLMLGHVFHQLHRFERSERIARALVVQRGLWADYALLGDVLMEQGQLLEAEKAYQAMVDQRPGPQAYMRAANMRWLKGDLSGSRELMRMVVGGLGENNREGAAWAWVRLADYTRQAKQFVLAESYLERALLLQPDYPPALLLRGEILMSREHYTEAIAMLARAVESNPLPLYQWSYIEALMQVGDEPRALQIKDSLMQHGASLDRRSFALYLAVQKQHAPRALILARQELELRQDVFTLDTMAWALYANGEISRAWYFANQAIAEGTQDARLFYHAAVIAEEIGQANIAVDYYRRAMDLQHLLLPSERQNMATRFAAISL